MERGILTGCKAVLLDRDDTICPDVPHNGDPSKMHIYPFQAEQIRRLNDQGYLVLVITNQSGIGRGMYTVDDMNAVHAEMERQLACEGAKIDGIYYCPHRPDENCDCRKPRTGMGRRAIGDHDLDPQQCWMIGDKDSDIQFGSSLGMRTIKVTEAYTLKDAVEEILGNVRTRDRTPIIPNSIGS